MGDLIPNTSSLSRSLMFWVYINYIRAYKSMWVYKIFSDEVGGMQKASQGITS